MANDSVRAWRQAITIPTYGTGKPDRNPMFLEKRVYQGSSGVVYPLPVVDHINDDKHDCVYQAVFLENEYLRIMILPELGGRVQMALDKTNEYHFVYYNRVIKPALVGLTGPWTSGGIEFNWPQHHRPGTFSPVECELAAHADGSSTVWCSEIDRMYRTKGMHGFTLYPGRAFLEIKVRLYNRTSEPQTFLWWANPAVHVDENHQSIFPPDVHAVMDHGKRDVSEFPIARGTYYKVDYSPGTDISRYKNLPVPTSYMAYRSDYNFVGSYDHGRRAGLLHVANHHISPGKKQWTWGHSEFGRAWDRHLTDNDGPYIELMCGVYTDNQPDFSWLMPGEEKSFSQFFMPYKGVGMVKNATIDAAVGLEIEGQGATVRAYTTAEYPNSRIVLQHEARVLGEAVFDGSPRSFFEAKFQIEAGVEATELQLAVFDATGRELVSYRPRPAESEAIPAPARAIGAPEKLDSVESLFLAGLHLEQYRHATREPEAYYREGLRRDPGDLRCNNALGRLLYRRGLFAEAERCFRTALERLTRHNPNPYDGEPYYNLGLSLRMQDRYDEAFSAFYKATWNATQQEASYFELARIACRRARWVEALELLDACLTRQANHHQAIHLKVFVLAVLGRTEKARTLADAELEKDPFNTGVLYEREVLRDGDFKAFFERMGDALTNYLELAIDYAHAGQYQRAVDVLTRWPGEDSPMVHYYLAEFYERLGNSEEAFPQAWHAAASVPYLCFPNRLEDIRLLKRAMQRNLADARAPYYLGNLWYDRRQYDRAIECWERARVLDPSFPTAWRNLGLAYFNKRGDTAAAWDALERAFTLDPTDARVLFELDQLARRLGHDPRERLVRLDEHPEAVGRRDDLFLERVTLLNQLGQHEAALERLLQRRFHPWEGGEGKVAAQFVLALTQLAREAIANQQYDEAIELLRRTEVWPDSLGEGKLPGIQENNIHYLLGTAYRQTGNEELARVYLEKASVGLREPNSAMYYNDQPPDMIFYQGLACQALGLEDEGRQRFERLVEYGRSHLNDEVSIDYFAVSLPDFLVFEDDLNTRHEVHCRYMMALGHWGLGQIEAANGEFARVLALDRNHLGALVHQSLSVAKV